MRIPETKHWSNALITTAALSVAAFLGDLLWTSGHAEWAFVLAFLTIWLLATLFWSNDSFNQHSDWLLAEAMDHNVDHLVERLEALVEQHQLAGDLAARLVVAVTRFDAEHVAQHLAKTRAR